MISVIRVTDHHPGSRRSSAVYEFACSELADVNNLPTSKTMARPYATTFPHPGSSCICTSNDEVYIYILGADDEWHQM